MQIGTYLAFLLAAGPEALGIAEVPMATLWWSAACFLAGYVLYGCLMAANGALGRSTQESAQIATVWMVAGALPLFFLGSITADGTSAIARILTWIPLTAPVALLLRIATESVSTIELAGALVLTLVTAAAALAVSAALLRRLTIAGAR
jgi:ABC-2 type transport system permease protein